MKFTCLRKASHCDSHSPKFLRQNSRQLRQEDSNRSQYSDTGWQPDDEDEPGLDPEAASGSQCCSAAAERASIATAVAAANIVVVDVDVSRSFFIVSPTKCSTLIFYQKRTNVAGCRVASSQKVRQNIQNFFFHQTPIANIVVVLEQGSVALK